MKCQPYAHLLFEQLDFIETHVTASKITSRQFDESVRLLRQNQFSVLFLSGYRLIQTTLQFVDQEHAQIGKNCFGLVSVTASVPFDEQ